MGKSIRYLEIKPLQNGLFLVTDPLAIADDFIVNTLVLGIMLLFDGQREDEEVRKEIIRQTGIFIPEDKFREIVNFFTHNGLFVNGDIKKIILEKSEELVKKGYIDFYFEVNLENFLSFLKLNEIDIKRGGNFKALLVPHLDLRVASDAYYRAYNEVSKENYKRIFIFGVSHYYHDGLFSVCPLDFQTPLGIIKTDKEVVINFQNSFNINPFERVLSYKKEHSILFQLPYIKYLFDKSKVVAVLVSYSESLEEVKRELDKFADFIVNNYPDSLFISSIDLSHVGKKFGDEFLIDPEEIDNQYIKLLLSLDSEESLNFLIKTQNKTRIDGMFTNYLFLKVLEKLGFKKGQLIYYNKYLENNSIVSYCSIGYI